MQSNTKLLLGLCLTLALPFAAQAGVAKLTSSLGMVEVQRGGTGSWEAIEVGADFEVGDKVRTRGSRAEVTFVDRDESTDAGPSVLSLDRNTTIEIESFEFEAGSRTKRSGIVEMLKGALYAVSKGWRNRGLFSVRVGTTVCGIRGSSVHVQAVGNTITITPLSGEIFQMELPATASLADVAAIATFIQNNSASIPALNVTPNASAQVQVNTQTRTTRTVTVNTQTFQRIKVNIMQRDLNNNRPAGQEPPPNQGNNNNNNNNNNSNQGNQGQGSGNQGSGNQGSGNQGSGNQGNGGAPAPAPGGDQATAILNSIFQDVVNDQSVSESNSAR